MHSTEKTADKLATAAVAIAVPTIQKAAHADDTKQVNYKSESGVDSASVSCDKESGSCEAFKARRFYVELD